MEKTLDMLVLESELIHRCNLHKRFYLYPGQSSEADLLKEVNPIRYTIQVVTIRFWSPNKDVQSGVTLEASGDGQRHAKQEDSLIIRQCFTCPGKKC